MHAWIKKMWYLHAMEYYSTSKKKREILSFVITWVNLDIILSEISQTQKNRCYMISLYEESRTVKLRSRVERWLLGSRGRRKQGGAGQKVQTFSSAR